MESLQTVKTCPICSQLIPHVELIGHIRLCTPGATLLGNTSARHYIPEASNNASSRKRRRSEDSGTLKPLIFMIDWITSQVRYSV